MSVNRFSKDAKLAKHIVPPRLLDVRRFMENVEDVLPSQYALAAQIVHVGESKHFGIIIFFFKSVHGIAMYVLSPQVTMFRTYIVKMVNGATTTIRLS